MMKEETVFLAVYAQLAAARYGNTRVSAEGAAALATEASVLAKAALPELAKLAPPAASPA